MIWRCAEGGLALGNSYSPRPSCIVVMLVPEEFRCCVCLSTPEQALLTGCPHRVCVACTEVGDLQTCPVCRTKLPGDRPVDVEFAARIAESEVLCECGAAVPVLQAEAHTCDHTRKRKYPEGQMLQSPSGRKPPRAPNRSTFACPVCDERNLTPQGLLEHCEQAHTSGSGRGSFSAVCPICMAMPWGDPTYVTRDFVAHLRLRHRCDYSVLADFEADEESMFARALRDSLKTAGFEAEVEEDDRILAEVLAQSAREAGSDSASSTDGTDGNDNGGDGSSDSGGSSSSSEVGSVAAAAATVTAE